MSTTRTKRLKSRKNEENRRGDDKDERKLEDKNIEEEIDVEADEPLSLGGESSHEIIEYAELPFVEVLADKRRKYSLKEEFVYLIYSDLIDAFTTKWDGTYLRKSFVPKNSVNGLSDREEEEENANEKVLEMNNDSTISENIYSMDPDWKISAPDETVEIMFLNKNTYTGRISRRKMEGKAVYKWSNGCQYTGDFEDNKIQGRGLLEWQDLSWYEGDFQDGYRHGRGTMVDKNYGLFYVGQWDQGHKHGKGLCRYENGGSYDGDWVMDKREGKGCRIYPDGSRYIGSWKEGHRHGTGVMIWKNGDIYSGEWKSGKMHGLGEYTWSGFFYNALCWPRENYYKGEWHEGTRHGKGQMTLNSIGGARFSGEWKENKKHGRGFIIGNNGDVTNGEPLFENDILLPVALTEIILKDKEEKMELDGNNAEKDRSGPATLPEVRVPSTLQPEQNISLRYYLSRNKGSITLGPTSSSLLSVQSGKCGVCDEKSCNCLHQPDQTPRDEHSSSTVSPLTPKSNLERMGHCEWSPNSGDSDYQIRNYINMHMPKIRNIYDIYSKIFCEKKPNHRFVSMTRLSLWQLWRDCKIHRSMSLIHIDRCVALNKDTLMENVICPFERIEIWQLIHYFMEVSWHFYTKKEENCEADYPEKLANGFHRFLINDVYPNVGTSDGLLCGPQKDMIPLQPLYQLYKSIGEPPSARQLFKTIFGEGGNKMNIPNDLSIVLRELGAKMFVEIMSKVCTLMKDSESGAIINIEYELCFLEFLEVFVEWGKQVIRDRKSREKTEMEEMKRKSESADRISTNFRLKDNSSHSSLRLSEGKKSTKSKKKQTTKR